MDQLEARQRANKLNKRYRRQRNIERILTAIKRSLFPVGIAAIPGTAFGLYLAALSSGSFEARLATMCSGVFLLMGLVAALALVVNLLSEFEKTN